MTSADQETVNSSTECEKTLIQKIPFWKYFRYTYGTKNKESMFKYILEVKKNGTVVLEILPKFL